ncbi:PQQ-binding-like beta-propeller repeat protein [Bacteroidota bacterium]
MRNLTLLLLSLFLIYSCSKKKEINQWRGDNRDGIYHETNLLKEWSENGPDLLWEFEEIGNGYGAPVITSDKIFVNGELDSISHLFAFNLEGQLLWKSEYDSSWVINFPGSRSAPTVVNDLVYVCSPKGEIVCFKSKDGSKLWSKNMLKDFNGVIPRFGFSQSLLVEGDKVYCAPGNKDTNFVALNRFTGETIWINAAKGEKPAYCSPLLVELPTRKLLVTFSEFSLFGLDAESGEMLWVHDQDTMGDVHGNTPIYEKDFIYYTTGCGNGTVKLQLSEDGNKIAEIWRNIELDNIMGGVVKVNNKIIGTGHQKQILKSLDAITGNFTDSLKVGRGSTIFADGLLYVYNEKGPLNLINPEPKLELISSFRIKKGTKEHFAFPVIKNGILYIRHGNTLMAYNIKKDME